MNTTISKQKIKWIRSLDKKKQRDKEQLFVAEGYKLVSELLSVFNCRYLVISNKISLPKALYNNVKETVVTNEEEIKKISNQKNPQGVLAVFEIIKHNYSYSDITQKTTLFLDDIQNPGNLGTIIRLADWFGIENIFCSQNTVDIFNPKTIQATMGAIARVKVHYVDKIDFLKNISQTTTVYGTFLDGKNIYQSPLQTSAIHSKFSSKHRNIRVLKCRSSHSNCRF